jgi:beta-lactamase regulating signal transducer with metallopeptidase domain
MTSWEKHINAALLNSLWQSVVIAFVVGATLAVLRKSDPRLRYALCCMGMLAMVVWPAISAWEISNIAYARIAASSSIQGLERWVPLAWSIGVSLSSLRLAWGYRTTRVLRKSGASFNGDIVQRVANKMRLPFTIRVAISPLVEVPSLVGLLRPLILIPTSLLTNLPTEQVEALLAHEIAHLTRWDHWVNAAQCCVQALLFYHPAAWWISSRIREERELCCDDLAVRATGGTLIYARALTALEKLRVSVPEVALASTHGSLVRRIRRLAGVHEGIAAAWAPVVVAVAVMVAMFPPPRNRVQAQTLPAQKAKPAQVQAQPTKPVQPVAAQPAKAAPRIEVKEEFPGLLDPASYAKAERDLAAAKGSVDSPEVNSRWRAVMYNAGFEWGALYYLQYAGLDIPEYQAMTASVRRADTLLREFQNSSTPEARAAKKTEVLESLEDVQKYSAILKERRLKFTADQNR